MHLLNPLSSCEFDRLPEDFPRVLDLMNLRVLELGHEYVLRCSNIRDNRGGAGVPFPDKVAFMCLGNGNDVAMLRIESGKLAMFKSEEKRWFLQDLPSPSPYDDVILFKGKFYAVDCAGRTVVVGLDLGVTLIVQSNFSGHKKKLVESVGELLMVYIYFSLNAGIAMEMTLRFNVYKLDREEKVWNGVKDLGDRVLFLGDECAFSASAADLGASKGNCIFYTGYVQRQEIRALGSVSMTWIVAFLDLQKIMQVIQSCSGLLQIGLLRGPQQ